MKYLMMAAALVAAPALAQTPAAPSAAVGVKKGAMVSTADGRRVGRVDFIRDENVGIIYNGKFINIPASTLTITDKGATTTLTRAEISKL